MFEYNAKPWHAFFSVLVLLLGSLVMAVTKHWAWILAGVGIWIIGFLMFVWMMYSGTHSSRAQYFDAISRLADTIRDLDQETREALGIRFPELRIRFRGHPRLYLEDTDIQMDHFYEFMRRSTEREICPERIYGDGTIARRQWTRWRDWLIENKYVIPDSNSGSHSWLFYGGAYQRLMDRYGYGKQLTNLNQAERGSNPANMEYVNEPEAEPA